MKFKPGSVVKVKWLDHCCYAAAWLGIDDISNEPVSCWSIGVVIKDSKTAVSIARTISEEQNSGFGGVGTILKADIVKYKVLEKQFD